MESEKIKKVPKVSKVTIVEKEVPKEPKKVKKVPKPERTPEQIQAAKDKMALVRAKKTQKVKPL